MNQIANERIAFQKKSPLADGLIQICTEFDTWVQNTKPAPKADGSLPFPSADREHAVMTQATENLAPALSKLCKKLLNITVHFIVVHQLKYFDNGMIPYFADLVDRHGIEAQNVGRDLFSGLQSYETTKYDLKVFDGVVDQVNFDTVKLRKATDKFMVMVWIYPGAYLAGGELYPTITRATPAQHAAAICHELGHAFAALEHIADSYHRADVATNSITYLSTTTNERDLDRASTTMTSSAIEDQAEIKETLNKDAKAKGNVIYRTLVGTVACYFLIVKFLSTWSRMHAEALYGRINASDQKTSDTVVTVANDAFYERAADEFVSRQGLGKDAADLLITLYTLKHSSTIMNDARMDDLLRRHRDVKIAMAVLNSIAGFVIMAFGVQNHLYDPPLMRLEHLLMNQMALFKDDKLPPEIRDRLIAETKQMLDAIAHYKTLKIGDGNKIFWSTLSSIKSRGSALDGLTTANLSRDYDRLQYLTNGLIKNPLAFHAARLQSLAKKP